MEPPWFSNVRLTGWPSFLKAVLLVGLTGISVVELPPQAASKTNPVIAKRERIERKSSCRDI
jgi:hypothetical protein|tara:strand:+ start:908 stop:1093 length:186 start_codon:yes stop_codon:yes gene_type:complete